MPSDRIKITRKLEFDAGHRLVNHESKCAHLHGHRYTAEICVSAPQLDSVGRVVDFSVLKSAIGGWIDSHWDHNLILNKTDPLLDPENVCYSKVFSKSPYIMEENPTVENMVVVLAEISEALLQPHGIQLEAIRLYETPNCWADWAPRNRTQEC